MEQVFQLDFLSSISNSGPVGIAIMLLLVSLSIWVWVVIFNKLQTLKTMQALSQEFIDLFWESKSLSELNIKSKNISYSPAREIFRAGFNETIRILQTKEKNQSISPVLFGTIKRSLSKQKMMEENHLSSNMSLLSICASAAPFIGLFGTVIGIIRAFHDIGTTGASSLAAVAPGISEALIATALGLFVAIPAVIFYNYLLSKIKQHIVLMEAFAVDFINILERHYGIEQED